MFIGFFYGAMYILGAWWCYVVIARLPGDIKELFEPRGIVWKFAIIFVWFLTILIAIALVSYSLAAVNGLVSFVRLFR